MSARDRMRRIHTIHFVGIGGSGMGGIAEVLLNLEGEAIGFSGGLKCNFEGVVNFRQCAFCGFEFDVHNGTDDLNDFTCIAHGEWFAGECWGALTFSGRRGARQLDFLENFRAAPFEPRDG